MEIPELKIKLGQTINHLNSEFAKVRAGRASAALVEGIFINAYEGSNPLKLNELATISIPGPSLIIVSPFDQSIIEKIETGIRNSDVKLSPVIDGNVIKISIPPLTEERRKEFLKLINDASENARQAVRNIRQDAMKAIDKLEQEKSLSEDESFRQKQEIERQAKDANEEIEGIAKDKERELMTV